LNSSIETMISKKFPIQQRLDFEKKNGEVN